MVDSAGILSSIQNTVLKPQAENVPRLIVIIGSYEAGKTITDEVPVLSLSSQETGSIYGFGSMLHRLHLQEEIGSAGQVSVYIQPQAETGGAAAAEGEVDFAGSVGVLAGTYSFYIGFDLVRVSVLDADTPTLLGDALEAAINANADLNFTASNLVGVVTITSKTLGVYANAAGGIGAQFGENLEAGQETPSGITTALTQPVGGTGLPDIVDALNGLGTGDNKNALGFTAGIHGYGQDSTTLDAILAYIGPGDQLTGTYQKEVARNFYFETGDAVADSAGLSALIVLGNSRKTDRANAICPVPGSNSHPSEIGAQSVGIKEREANRSAGKGYVGFTFSRIHPGLDSDRWTNDRTNRTLAIQAGIGSTTVDGNTVALADTVTMYHPDSVPSTSNIYRELANISKIRNILANEKATFTAQTLAKSIIVEDINTMSSIQDKQFAIDIDTVTGTHITLIKSFNKKGWLYETAFAIANLQVAIRPGTDGFDSIIKAILSGVNKISDNQVQADISIAVLS